MSDVPREDRPASEPGRAGEGKVAAVVAWVLYLLSIPSGTLCMIVGVVVAYVTRASATGLARTHLDAQIALFWSVFWWTLALWIAVFVSAVFSAVLIGIPFLLLSLGGLVVLHIWFTVKSIIGLLHLADDRAP